MTNSNMKYSSDERGPTPKSAFYLLCSLICSRLNSIQCKAIDCSKLIHEFGAAVLANLSYFIKTHDYAPASRLHSQNLHLKLSESIKFRRTEPNYHDRHTVRDRILVHMYLHSKQIHILETNVYKYSK